MANGCSPTCPGADFFTRKWRNGWESRNLNIRQKLRLQELRAIRSHLPISYPRSYLLYIIFRTVAKAGQSKEDVHSPASGVGAFPLESRNERAASIFHVRT